MREVKFPVGLYMDRAIQLNDGMRPNAASHATARRWTRVRWPGAGGPSRTAGSPTCEHQFESVLRSPHGAVAERAGPGRARPGRTAHRIRVAGVALRGRRGAEDLRNGAGGPGVPGPGHGRRRGRGRGARPGPGPLAGSARLPPLTSRPAPATGDY